MQSLQIKMWLRSAGIALLAALAHGAPFRLASIFQNGMVLQRNAPIPVWGWTTPGATVFGTMWRPGNNASAPINASSTADANGLFILTFPSQAGENLNSQSERMVAVSTAPISPSCLAFQHYCRGAFFSISAVIGDVILCTGQSNMQVNVGFAFNATEELAAANYYTNAIRLFQVRCARGTTWSVVCSTMYRLTQVTASALSTDVPLDDLPLVSVPWLGASNTSLPSFSATCWYSGKALYDSRPPGTSIPLGLIETCWGGTPIKVSP